MRRAIRISVAFISVLPVLPALGQHSLSRTITVDPSGNADHQTIQGGINDSRIGSNPAVRFTVFLYAGTYAENVTLDGTKENVDLVGVDRDAVIIAPSSGDGIVITSGTETSRNNSIRNLTIRTTSGHGIRIVKGGGGSDQTPKDIVIDGVTIEADGTSKNGILGEEAERVRVSDCAVTSDDGDAVVVGSEWTLESIQVEATVNGSVDQDGIVVDTKSDLTILNAYVFAEKDALFLKSSTDVLVQGSEIRSPGGGGAYQGAVSLEEVCERVTFQDCLIVSDGTGTTRTSPRGVMFDTASTSDVDDILFQGCRIVAIGGEDATDVAAVQMDMEGNAKFLDCDLFASNIEDSGDPSAVAEASGVKRGTQSGRLDVIGGSIETVSGKKKESYVYDLDITAEVGAPMIRVGGTRFSKWRGPIASAERPRSTVQRTVNAAASSTAAVLSATTLTGSEQSITTGITDPDVYRVLSITGDKAIMSQDVYVVGTDFAGNAITDRITLSGTSTVAGLKPFMTVTEIILPAASGPSQTVAVGTTSKLGLQFPISATSDVLQQGRKAGAATSYTLESVGTVDDTYATVDVGTITANDSFEWVVLASQ